MRCDTCGCTLFSCQCPSGPANPLVEPIPDDCLAFLRGPKICDDGKIAEGVLAGMTPEEVLSQRESYRRMVGE